MRAGSSVTTCASGDREHARHAASASVGRALRGRGAERRIRPPRGGRTVNVRQRTENDGDVFELSREELDALPYGVVTLDRRGTVLRYNETEATFARRSPEKTIGLNFFADVAPCTNVQAFKGRFDAFAAQTGSGVDRFDFSFAFRWGRHDVSITLLRKVDHDEINVLVRGRSIAALEVPAAVPQPHGRRRGDAATP